MSSNAFTLHQHGTLENRPLPTTPSSSFSSPRRVLHRATSLRHMRSSSRKDAAPSVDFPASGSHTPSTTHSVLRTKSQKRSKVDPAATAGGSSTSTGNEGLITPSSSMTYTTPTKRDSTQPSPYRPYFEKYPRRNVRTRSGSVVLQRPTTAPASQQSIDETSTSSAAADETTEEEPAMLYPFPSKASTAPNARSRISPLPSASPFPPPRTSSRPKQTASPYGLYGGFAYSSSSDSSQTDLASPQEPPTVNNLAPPSFDVTSMDALVAQMNGGRRDSAEMSAFSSASQWDFSVKHRQKGSSHHPLYHPPLPKPPPGVTLGRRMGYDRASSSTESPRPSMDRYSQTTADTSSSTGAESIHSSSPPSLYHANTVSESSFPTESQLSTPNASIGDLARGYKGTPSPKRKPTPTIVPSITDIILAHAPEHARSSKMLPRSFGQSVSNKSLPLAPHDEEPFDSRSSMDSIAEEAIKSPFKPFPRPNVIHHAKSFPNRPLQFSNLNVSSSYTPSMPGSPLPPLSPRSDDDDMFNGSEYSVGSLTIAPRSPLSKSSGPASPTYEMAQYLRSPRLTRLITLRRHPNAGITVSLADVGSPTGHPVVMYLGLGCVRYIIGLYDEMAEALNLRLICVDRWGLGRTSDVPPEKRGMLEWASVMEEVMDALGVKTFSVVAHSAGAPYSLASTLRMGSKVHGSVHLLAPWVSVAVDGGYKWLKYVPSGLIKTAQTAEWKVQGWKIGKPPTITYEGIGFDLKAPISSPSLSPPHSMSMSKEPSQSSQLPRKSTSSEGYDDLADFNGRFSSSTTLAGVACGDPTPPPPVPPIPPPKQVKKKQSRSFLGLFDSRSKRQLATSSSRPPTQRSGSMPASAFQSASPTESPTLKSGWPASAVGRSHTSPVLGNPNTGLSPTLEQQLQNVTEWGANVLASTTLAAVPNPSDSRSSLERTGGRRSISLSARSVPIPPVPPLPNVFTTSMGSVENEPVSPGLSNGSNVILGRKQTVRSASVMSGKSGKTSRTAYSTASAPAAAAAKRSQKPGGITLASALLQASHAEALKGGGADLLSILERGDSRPWGFAYTDVKHPVKVWYGDKDDKIGIGSVRWMERAMKDCQLKIVKGEGHSLLTNAQVVVEVLESIADEWR